MSEPGFTAEECKALRVALAFGVPDEPHQVLESARRKLAAMEAAATSLGDAEGKQP